MSAHLVPSQNQVGQTDLNPLTEKSPSPPPPMELKPLPSHLKYAYLDKEHQLLVIIANNLYQEQEDKLLEVLRQHKRAMGWKLSDLPGINSSICTHRILMKEEVKPIRQQQRRLNPTLLDVVKKEVTKLLAAGIIYPISDSQWVSPVQVVPKKSGMTVTKNQHDELVPTRIQNSCRDCMEVFMDDFTVYADSFEACMSNLSKVLKRYVDTNLVLHFEKCHFMVTKEIVLGHLVSNKGIEVDIAKIDIITSLPNPTFVREDVEFNFDQPCIKAFQELKNRLTSAPILQVPNWDLPFELMCDASNSTLGAVLGQRARVGQPMHVIAYASKTMDLTQQNYTTTEKELLAIVFSLDKFRSYLLDLKILVEEAECQTKIDLVDALLQEFDIEIRDKKGVENSIADHLRTIEKESEPMPIRDEFPNEQLLHIKASTPWFADICNYVATSQFPPEAFRLYKEKLQSDAKYYIWEYPYLWRLCNDKFCHSTPRGGHYGSTQTARKVLDCGLYWPTIFRDAHHFVSTCKRCQKAGMAMNQRHEMPQQPILFCEVFDVWGIDFMGPFPISNGYSYILLAVDYVSRWVEAIATRTNDAKICHLPMELEHKAYWAVKHYNLAYDQVGEQRKFQLQELDELFLETYENSRIYKQNVKKFHDQKILRKDFHVG
ncbi:Retrovirus-related Pol polyprotein, partial [Mucuna pruriens]